MYSNAKKFWGNYLHTAGDILQPSFATRMASVGQKHASYVQRKVGALKESFQGEGEKGGEGSGAP